MKLIMLLKALHTDEYKDFERYLQSPYFRHSKNFTTFFNYLFKHHPDLNVDKAALETAFKRCLKGHEFTGPKFHNMLSKLSRAVEDFLVIQNVLGQNGDGNPRLRKQLLLQVLSQKSTRDHLQLESDRLIEDVRAIKVKEMDDYLTLHRAHHQLFFHPDTAKLRPESPDLELAMANLDLFYMLTKLHYAAEMKTREGIFELSYDIPLLEEIMDLASHSSYDEKHTLISIYRKLTQLYMLGVSETSYRELKELFFEKFELIPKQHQRYLVQHMVNYGIFLSGKGFDVAPELLGLYKKSIDAGTAVTEGRMTDTTFTNIANTAAQCKDFEWGEAFILNYQGYLEPRLQSSAVAFAEATLLYYQKKLDKAQKRLNDVNFSDPAFATIGRWLLVMIVFDRYMTATEDYNFLQSQFRTFERFVQNKDLSAEKKNGLLNRLSFLRKLATLKSTGIAVPEQKKQLLRQKLHSTNPVFGKSWLLERIDKL